MVNVLLILGCVVSLLLLAGLAAGIILVMKSDRQDAVSTARQGWMDSGSRTDDEDQTF